MSRKGHVGSNPTLAARLADCFVLNSTGINTPKGVIMSEVRKPNSECCICSKPIYRRPNELERGSVFCSIICSNNRHKKEDPQCVVCGVTIPRRKHAKTCGRTCSNKSRYGSTYGQGRPNDKAAKFKTLKIELLKIREHKCNRCPYGRVEILQVHHIIERSKGGSDELNNLELLCPTCHVEHHYDTKTKDNLEVWVSG